MPTIERLEVVGHQLCTPFEGDYRARRRLIESQFGERTEQLFGEIEKRARERGIAFLRTPVGVGLAPLRADGEVIEPAELERLPANERERLGAAMAELQEQLVFEQSYSGVEGDSASCAELCALLSAIAETPVRQSLAVTGSVNQQGQVQAVGGVAEKVEGFFDVCKAAGLTGEEGVLIPAANVKHLMLRRDVVEAVERGLFRVYPVETVDEALELLTGLPAGTHDATGEFPEGSLNRRVEARLVGFAEKLHAFAKLAD